MNPKKLTAWGGKALNAFKLFVLLNKNMRSDLLIALLRSKETITESRELLN